MSGKRPESSDFEAEGLRMRRLIGVAMLLPGLGLLALGAYLLTLSVVSYNALLCCGAIGGGLTLIGANQLLGNRSE